MKKPQKTNANHVVEFALGSPSNLGLAETVSEPWGVFKDRFHEPLLTDELFAEYLESSREEQTAIKKKPGWYIRTSLRENRRRSRDVKPGRILTLDIDYATRTFLRELVAGRILAGFEFFVHSTHSHTLESPRLRLVALLKCKVGPKYYGTIARLISQLIDPKLGIIDKASVRPAQMMFLPSVSCDMREQYFFYEQAGHRLDPRKLIADWESGTGHSVDDLSALPRFPGEKEPRESGQTSEDPLIKKGDIGAFCRAHSITDLIEGGHDGILGTMSEKYVADDYEQGAVSRATYLGGSSAGGVVVYEDKWVFSYHATDPCEGHLLNAYDWVRISCFGELDPENVDDIPMGKRPSVKAMREQVIDHDDAFQKQLIEDQYDLDAMFDDADVAENAPQDSEQTGLEKMEELDRLLFDEPSVEGRYARLSADPPRKGWIGSQLTINRNGTIRSDAMNVATILTNDPRFFRKIAWNEFTEEPVIIADIETKNPLIQPLRCHDPEMGTPWQASYDLAIQAILESGKGPGKTGYGMKVAQSDLYAGIKLAARNNSFNPVIERILSFASEHPDDGIDYLGGFAPTYLGTENNAYTREVMTIALVASVARAFEPGCKFDHMPILQGVQEIGKSSLIRMIYGDDLFGELDADLKDRKACAEQIKGKHGMEMPEMSSFNKADHDQAKQFVTRQDDTVRLSYDRSNTILPRKTVFWGTSNPQVMLRDPTGNRRYWPLHCAAKQFDFKALGEVIPKLWAQAYRIYKDMRARQPNMKLNLNLSLGPEATRIAKRVQESARKSDVAEEWANQIEDYFNESLPLGTVINEIIETRNCVVPESSDSDQVCRLAASPVRVREDCLGLKAGTLRNQIDTSNWQGARDTLESRGFTFTTTKGGDYSRVKSPRIGGRWTEGRGVQRMWILAPGWRDHDLRDGFRPLDGQDAEEEPDDLEEDIEASMLM